jgi:hypothetical protein
MLQLRVLPLQFRERPNLAVFLKDIEVAGAPDFGF